MFIQSKWSFITAHWKAIAGFFEDSDNHMYIGGATLKQITWIRN